MSVGDPHATQGDGELGGTAIECSMTGTFQLIPHKKARCARQRLVLAALDLGFEHVVMARIYLMRFRQDYAAMNEPYRNYFSQYPNLRRGNRPRMRRAD
jgi:acetamidase/formamidase